MGEVLHLASGLYSLPDAEVADDPCNSQTDHQVPVQRPDVVNTWRYSQHSSPGNTHMKTGQMFHLAIEIMANTLARRQREKT